MELERIATGISRFDELLMGGFPRGSIVLVTGVPGSGKTIFCLQVARNLAKKDKKVLYVTIDGETPQSLLSQTKMLGIDFEPFLEKGIKLIRLTAIDEDFKKFVRKSVKDGFSVVIIDSLSGALPRVYSPEEIAKYVLFKEVTVMGILDPNFVLRWMISDMFEFLRGLELDLVLVTTDRVEGQAGLSRDAISEFIVDAIVDFETLGVGGAFSRTLRILKLRMSDHHKDPVTFEIGKGGIAITERKIEEIAREF
jgi:circadian clock protein KaiC